MLKHKIQKSAKGANLTFSYRELSHAVRIKLVGRKGDRCEWQMTGAEEQPPPSSLYDLSFSFMIGSEIVNINMRDFFDEILLIFDMSKDVKLDIVKKL